MLPSGKTLEQRAVELGYVRDPNFFATVEDGDYLLLPAPHSREQENLINAWDLRYDPNDPKFDPADPINTSFYDPSHPRWNELPRTFKNLRFVTGACGSKFGKTYGCAIRLVKEAWENTNIIWRTWWVAPTYDQAESAMLFVRDLLPRGSFRVQEAKHRIWLLNEDGSDRCMIEFKSGDKPESLRGYAVVFFIMDEVAQGMPEASYVSVLTTTTQTEGRGIFISTPNGAGWFKDIYERGVKYYDDGTPKFNDEDNVDPFPEWFSVRMPTHVNPTVKLEEILIKKKTLTENQFRQEILAQFIDDANSVFKHALINACIKRGTSLGFREPERGHFYVVGADIAKHKDYTVLTVMDRQLRHVVYIERFNKISWEHIKQRIIFVSKRYNNALVLLDATGVGDAIYDDLIGAGLNIKPYSIHSNEKKRLLIEKLIIAIENQRISFPPGDKDHPAAHALKEELMAFEYKHTPSGAVTYSAPSNKHDDCVLSLAFACFIAEAGIQKYKHKQIRGV